MKIPKFSVVSAGLIFFIDGVNDASNSAKKGLAFNDPKMTHHFDQKEVGWAYNWASSHPGSIPKGVDYFPMLWDDRPGSTNTWHAHADAAINHGSTHLLGFNEPDNSGQANMSPADAARAWKKWMEPFHGKAKLVSPAVTNGAAPMGLDWLDKFNLDACQGCHVDAVAIHIYDSATNEAYYKSYIKGAVDKYKKPVLVTEWGASGSPDEQVKFIKEMVPWLDGLKGVSHQAWFADIPGVHGVSASLVNKDGSLTNAGKAYVDS